MSCWQRVSSQAKKRPLLMVMSCHGEFSFCWDRSCGAFPPRRPATERLLSTESYLASAQRVCWIRKLMRVPRGLVSTQTSLPSFQAHQGASFLDSCPSPSSLQGEEQASVWQEQDTLGGFTQSPAVRSWLAEWSWLLVGNPMIWSTRTDGCDAPFIPTFMPCWYPSLLCSPTTNERKSRFSCLKK